MEIIFAGVWTGPNRRDFDGKQVAVLFGDADAFRGARIGQPVTVTKDPTGPLRLIILGEWDAGLASDVHEECGDGSSCVVIEGAQSEVTAMSYDIGFSRPCRLVYLNP